MKTFIILALLTASAAGGGWWYYQKQQEEQEIRYVTSIVERDTITKHVTATGILNPVINVQVGSQISGNIKELFADFNSDVKAGQVVAQLDPAVYQAVVAQQEGEVANASASLELAKQTAKRKQELFERAASSQADLDSAIAELARAEAQLKIRTANLLKAKVDLDRCTIYSPIDGTVITRDVDVGQTVAASMSAPVLFTIANDLTKMQINAAVAEMDVGTVKESQKVDFTVDAFPFDTFKGQVTQVRNAATTVSNVVTYDVIITVDNSELKLKPGMTADVKIIVAESTDALRVPNAALRYRPPAPPSESKDEKPGEARGPRGPRGGSEAPKQAVPERTVYLLQNNLPVAQSVKIGIEDGIGTEVIEGLTEGAEVITGHTGGPTRSLADQPNPFSGGGMRRRM
ncbi:efflux RND transporter periplasmic adaptor subunit [Phragmitibacter flavus]|uniref:Efflux RND transporter periplasmic adaptor subunit n=1 Tax=Phragmitibacter flavus TaxID=2576071 RepID=A0A5R8KJH4_9BACT|nr:efflux RND transporter periplasmic adaptor subunit [Phragmitibacter flavus]TLD72464.1 efflux RND transporter periplasmic adaptor subunit [Phragmitibacter flavus]